jgi:carbon monoxide dehydrogenase subunit G
MKISGTYQISATREEVWNKVMDPRVLERITPGVKSLEEIGEDTYIAHSEISIGPVRGAFKGNLSVKDKVGRERCLLVVDQKSKSGNVVAEIAMIFVSMDGQKTEIRYTGEARLSGMLASMGQRIMSGVVATLSKQFFQALEQEIDQEIKPGTS